MGRWGSYILFYFGILKNVPNYFSCDRLIKVAHYKKENKFELGRHLKLYLNSINNFKDNSYLLHFQA